MEKATIVYDLTREPAFKVCPAEGQAVTPEVEKDDGWFLQIAHFAEAVRGEKVKPITTLEESRDSVKIVAAEKESASKRQKVQIA
jgi:predicted dehydrogenase